MTVIPAADRFIKVRERRKLKLSFVRIPEPINDESPPPPTAA